MKKTRRTTMLLALIAVLALAVAALVSCANMAVITFDGNGATGGTAPQAINTTMGSTVTLPECELTKTGHTFDGWKTGDTTYKAGDTFKVTAAETTFVAQWKAEQGEPDPDPETYALTYAKGDHGTGTAPAAVQKEAGAKFNLAAATLFTAETGYEFDGWSDGANSYAADAEFTMPAKAVTMTAQWKAVQHTVTFDPNNEGAPWTVKVNHGETVAKPSEDPTISSGKTFRYWANGSEYNFSTPVTEDIELTATYAWKVTFLAGEGATGTVESQWVTMWRPNAITLPQATGLSNGSKIFVGWNDGTATYDAGDLYGTSGLQNVTFTAQWNDSQPIDPNKFTLTFTTGSGEGTPPAARQLAAGETTTLPDGTGMTIDSNDYPNYVFLGWSIKWNSEILKAGSTYTMPAANTTLQARWGEQPSQPDPSKKYNVTWLKSSNESQIANITGDLPATLELAAGATITMPAANTLTFVHYTLTKWRVQVFVVDDDGSGNWETMYDGGNAVNIAPEGTLTMPAQSIRIVAVWEQNKVTVSFDANGGTGTMSPVQKSYSGYLGSGLYDCKFTAPAGQEFDGWALSANGPKIEQDPKLSDIVGASDAVTLYAIWKSATVTPTTPLIDEIKGSWTATGHTLDIIAGSEDGNEFVKGYAILDGTILLRVLENKGVYYLVDTDITGEYDDNDNFIPNPYHIQYAVDLSGSTLTLTSDEEDSIVFNTKTTLNNTERSSFCGKWSKILSNNTQPWVITATDVYYNSNLTKTKLSFIAGDKLGIIFEVEGYEYSYVLNIQNDTLVGTYKQPQKAIITNVAFKAGEFLTLTVDGELNQIVNSGSAPDASKITNPTAPEGQIFSKWVLADTETEFDLTVAMTADASIVAVFEADATANVKTFIGAGTINVFSQDWTFTQFDIDFGAMIIKGTLASNDVCQLTIKNAQYPNYKPDTYGDTATYYDVTVKVGLKSFDVHLVVNEEQTKLTLCREDDTPCENGEFSTQVDSSWKVLSKDDEGFLALCNASTKLYFEESFVNGGATFLGVQFKYDTNLGVRICPIFVSNGAEKVGTGMNYSKQSEDNGAWMVFANSLNTYILVIGQKTDGTYYLTSILYKNETNDTERTLSSTTCPSF